MGIDVGSVRILRSRVAEGTGLSYAIYKESMEAWERTTPNGDRQQAHQLYVDFAEGLARAIAEYCGAYVGVQGRTFQVGQEAWMYQTVQEAIDAINADPVPPSPTDRAMIYIWPGFYETAATIDVPSDVVVCGVNPRACTLYNPTSNMFRVMGPRVYFYDFLVKGCEDPTKYAFDGNDQSTIRVQNVDMVATGGANGQAFFYQSGANWTNLVISGCTLDSAMLTGRLIRLNNTSGAARAVATRIERLTADCNSLTSTGGTLRIGDCTGVRLFGCAIVGSDPYNEGVYVVRESGSTGTPSVEIENSTLVGGNQTSGNHGPLVVGANCAVTLRSTVARVAYNAGSITSYSSTYT
jgi:hypothetical protein